MTWTKEKVERAREMAEPLTPRSEMPRATYGSLLFQLPGGAGFCPRGRCFRKANHSGDCYPRET